MTKKNEIYLLEAFIYVWENLKRAVNLSKNTFGLFH